jgi:hypothetical protein
MEVKLYYAVLCQTIVRRGYLKAHFSRAQMVYFLPRAVISKYSGAFRPVPEASSGGEFDRQFVLPNPKVVLGMGVIAEGLGRSHDDSVELFLADELGDVLARGSFVVQAEHGFHGVFLPVLNSGTVAPATPRGVSACAGGPLQAG